MYKITVYQDTPKTITIRRDLEVMNPYRGPDVIGVTADEAIRMATALTELASKITADTARTEYVIREIPKRKQTEPIIDDENEDEICPPLWRRWLCGE